jgi:ubiquinone biosynthesis protein COQ9
MALIAALRTDPAGTLLVYMATLRSMKWLLEAAGVPATGLTGQLRVHGLMALWVYALRAWARDESADLSSTMAAVDRGLDRAMQAERGLPGRRASPDKAAEPDFPPA